MYAQVMRALGKSDSANEKQTIILFRLMYNRLYYQFKPKYDILFALFYYSLMFFS